MRERGGPGYGLRGPRHDALQFIIALLFGLVAGTFSGWLWSSPSFGLLVGIVIFGICFGIG